MDGKVKNVKINANTQSIYFDAPDKKKYLVLKDGVFCSVYNSESKDGDFDGENWKYVTQLKILEKVTAQKIWDKLSI